MSRNGSPQRKRRQGSKPIISRRFVSIVKPKNGRRRTEKYSLENARVAQESSAPSQTGDDELGVETFIESEVLPVTTAPQKKTKASALPPWQTVVTGFSVPKRLAK